MSVKVRFDDFVKAIEELDLGAKDVKATAHTSAVSVNWDQINELAEKGEGVGSTTSREKLGDD